MKALRMEHRDDPAKEIWDRVGSDIEGLHIVPPHHVLVAIYQRPTRTKGGIILTEKTQDEDIWQGKVGLILKMGEFAFADAENYRWPQRRPKVGDWVAFRVGDTWQLIVGEQHCRMLEDVHFRFILDKPDLVY